MGKKNSRSECFSQPAKFFRNKFWVIILCNECWPIRAASQQKTSTQALFFKQNHAITSKFKMCRFPNVRKVLSWKVAVNRYNLVPLVPDENKTFSGSLVLDVRISWCHVRTLHKQEISCQRTFGYWSEKTPVNKIMLCHSGQATRLSIFSYCWTLRL